MVTVSPHVTNPKRVFGCGIVPFFLYKGWVLAMAPLSLTPRFFGPKGHGATFATSLLLSMEKLAVKNRDPNNNGFLF